MMAWFIRNNGQWLIATQKYSGVNEGMRVYVARKDGGHKQVTVGKFLWETATTAVFATQQYLVRSTYGGLIYEDHEDYH